MSPRIASAIQKQFRAVTAFVPVNQQIDAGFLSHLEELKNFLLIEKKSFTRGHLPEKRIYITAECELRSHIQNDESLHLDTGEYSAHACVNVFKAYLSELPEPILIDALYPAHLQIASLCL
uniref:Rho-GAP domain-containing protein n=1 Tax=Glossina austeni TaxID=7395 RepID=A0A1A9UUT8_GLOAU